VIDFAYITFRFQRFSYVNLQDNIWQIRTLVPEKLTFGISSTFSPKRMAFLSPANTVKLWRFRLLYIVHVTSVTMHRFVRLFSTSTHQYLQKLETVIGILYYRIFRTISRNFFKNSGVAAYIAVRLMCGRFQETTHYTLHATACFDQHLITISSPTVLHNHWLSLQPCGHPSPPGVSVSLSGGRLMHVLAERGKTPAWSPVLGTQVAVVNDIAISEA